MGVLNTSKSIFGTYSESGFDFDGKLNGPEVRFSILTYII